MFKKILLLIAMLLSPAISFADVGGGTYLLSNLPGGILTNEGFQTYNILINGSGFVNNINPSWGVETYQLKINGAVVKEGISTDRGYNTYTLILDGNSPYAGLKMHGEYYSFQLASDGSSIGKNGDGIFAVVASELAPMDVVQSGGGNVIGESIFDANIGKYVQTNAASTIDISASGSDIGAGILRNTSPGVKTLKIVKSINNTQVHQSKVTVGIGGRWFIVK